MDAKIDYLSYTLRIDLGEVGEGSAVIEYLTSAINTNTPTFTQSYAPSCAWLPGGKRGNYGASLQDTTYGARIWYGGVANHILIELPGMACQQLRDLGVFDALLLEVGSHVTRLDIAVDLAQTISPGDFIAAGHNQRFASGGFIWSPDGVTCYVGSQKSERFARVYRYDPPHPRAGITRVEHVLRSHYAKAALPVLLNQGVVVLAAQAGNSFAWKSDAWQPGTLTGDKLRSKKTDRDQPSKVRWLYQVVKPAIVKAAAAGLIDLDAWLSELVAFNATLKQRQQQQQQPRKRRTG